MFNPQTLLRMLSTIIIALLVTPVFGNFFVELAREQGWYKDPTLRITVVIDFFELITTLKFFYPVFYFTLGAVSVSWLIYLLRNKQDQQADLGSKQRVKQKKREIGMIFRTRKALQSAANLPAYEIEKKLRVIDEILLVLNDGISKSIDQGRHLAGNWMNGYRSPEHYPHYAEDLSTLRDSLKNQFNALEKVIGANPQYRDLKEIVLGIDNLSIITNIETFLITYGGLASYFKPDVSNEVFEWQMKNPRKEMDASLAKLADWKHDTSKQLIELRSGLTN